MENETQVVTSDNKEVVSEQVAQISETDVLAKIESLSKEIDSYFAETYGEQEDVSSTEIVEKDKVFTQAQLDEIIVARLGKEKARMLKRLGVDDEAKIDEILQKANGFETAKSEIEQLKSLKMKSDKVSVLNKLNADPEFTDYLLEKIEVSEGETFEAKAQEYLATHKKFQRESFNPVDSSVSIKGEPYPDFTNMTTEQYLAWRAKNPL